MNRSDTQPEGDGIDWNPRERSQLSILSRAEDGVNWVNFMQAACTLYLKKWWAWTIIWRKRHNCRLKQHLCRHLRPSKFLDISNQICQIEASWLAIVSKTREGKRYTCKQVAWQEVPGQENAKHEMNPIYENTSRLNTLVLEYILQYLHWHNIKKKWGSLVPHKGATNPKTYWAHCPSQGADLEKHLASNWAQWIRHWHDDMPPSEFERLPSAMGKLPLMCTGKIWKGSHTWTLGDWSRHETTFAVNFAWLLIVSDSSFLGFQQESAHKKALITC